MGNLIRDRLRACHVSLRRRWEPLVSRLLYRASESEAITLRPGKPAPWRERYLNFRGVVHGGPYYIGRGFWMQNDGMFSFGKRCSFGEFARIMNHAPISVGDDFIAATGLQINSGDHDPSTMAPRSIPVKIGNRVWCGANVTILAGVVISDDAVIEAGSLVRENVGANTIVAGVPARPIRTVERDTAKM